MAQATPPAFEEGSKCAVCSCNFGTFKRRHHCRACGRSLCSEHSSSLKALPQFGLHTPVRVCRDCFAEEEGNAASPAAVPSETAATIEVDEPAFDVATLKIAVEEIAPAAAAPEAFKCSCGMPLCICSTSQALPKAAPPVQSNVAPPRSKKVSRPAAVPKPAASSTTTATKTLPSFFFSASQSTHQASVSYDANEEGLREAIKNGDGQVVKDLLLKGIDANYSDKQGMSLLHLAAVFNFTDIAFMLVDAGANAHAKNPQGETPLDCAQTTLRNKLQKKLDDMEASK